MFDIFKFFGTPLKEIKSQFTSNIVFKFDTKGEFITDDPVIIDRAKGHFDHLELKAEPIGERVKIGLSGDFKCKKCPFTTDTWGKLMAHIRKEHPKEVIK